jgi:hypothetical protein
MPPCTDARKDHQTPTCVSGPIKPLRHPFYTLLPHFPGYLPQAHPSFQSVLLLHG